MAKTTGKVNTKANTKAVGKGKSSTSTTPKKGGKEEDDDDDDDDEDWDEEDEDEDEDEEEEDEEEEDEEEEDEEEEEEEEEEEDEEEEEEEDEEEECLIVVPHDKVTLKVSGNEIPDKKILTSAGFTYDKKSKAWLLPKKGLKKATAALEEEGITLEVGEVGGLSTMKTAWVKMTKALHALELARQEFAAVLEK